MQLTNGMNLGVMERHRENLVAMCGSGMLLVGIVEAIKKIGKRTKRTETTRKLLHVAAGPIFMMTWPWFSKSEEAKWFAAVVPFVMTLKFALVGLGRMKDEDDVRIMARSGKAQELLRGPLIYGLVFIGATLFAFRELTAAAALIALCFGDAAAALIGARYGHTNKLPWSPKKSFIGSFAFLAASTLGILLAAFFFGRWQFVQTEDVFLSLFWPAFLASLAGALVETLPFPEIDNLFVPAAVAAVFRSLLLYRDHHLLYDSNTNDQLVTTIF